MRTLRVNSIVYRFIAEESIEHNLKMSEVLVYRLKKVPEKLRIVDTFSKESRNITVTENLATQVVDLCLRYKVTIPVMLNSLMYYQYVEKLKVKNIHTIQNTSNLIVKANKTFCFVIENDDYHLIDYKTKHCVGISRKLSKLLEGRDVFTGELKDVIRIETLNQIYEV